MTNGLVQTSGPAGVIICGGQLTLNQTIIETLNNGSGTGGAISLYLANDIKADDGCIYTFINGPGSAGQIGITAANVQLSNGSQIFSQDLDGATKNSSIGSVTIDCASLSVNGANSAISTTAVGAASGGKIDIRASGALTISGESPSSYSSTGIYANSQPSDALGRGGDCGAIDIRAARIDVSNQGAISNTTFGSGVDCEF
jgi:hypothetical protein